MQIPIDLSAPTNPLMPRQPRRTPAPAVRRELTRLLNQQFWLFGYDVRRKEGNLLSLLGFEKCKHPEPGKHSPSRYSLTLESGSTIVLWGFGLFWTTPGEGSVFISRHAWSPKIRFEGTPVPDAWTPVEIPGLLDPCAATQATAARLTRAALDWIARYETFVIAECGCDYRDQAIAAWQKPQCRAADLVTRWETAGRAIS